MVVLNLLEIYQFIYFQLNYTSIVSSAALVVTLQKQLKIGFPQLYATNWPLVEEGYRAILIISRPTWKVVSRLAKEQVFSDR